MNISMATFLYFAYGSNLLAQRIHQNNPSAVRKDIAILHDYRLDFNVPYSQRWGGCAATIVPHKGKHVWGAIWEMNNSDIESLDKQEGVNSFVYFPFNVTVVNNAGTKYDCRTYQLVDTPTALEPGQILPTQRQPSRAYLNCILSGAIESNLPSYYTEELKKFPHNGNLPHALTPVRNLKLII